MTAPTTTVVCDVCGGPIEPAGWPSWRHVGRTRDGTVHAAQPDQATRDRYQPAAVTLA